MPHRGNRAKGTMPVQNRRQAKSLFLRRETRSGARLKNVFGCRQQLTAKRLDRPSIRRQKPEKKSVSCQVLSRRSRFAVTLAGRNKMNRKKHVTAGQYRKNHVRQSCCRKQTDPVSKAVSMARAAAQICIITGIHGIFRFLQ
jgi:hypothetical protein